MSTKQIYLKIAEAARNAQSTTLPLAYFASSLEQLAAQEPEPVEERWRPEFNQRYWTPYFTGSKWKTMSWINSENSRDGENINAGLCFKTEPEAEAKAEELRKLTGLK